MATITELVSTNTSAVVTIFEASATINDIPFHRIWQVGH
jgi:hypothetical protein